MKFDKLINNLMPLVGAGSDLPCVVWRNNGDWQLDYINLPPEKAEAYILGIKAHDPCAINFKSSDYVNREYTKTAVSDYVLSERLWAEYKNHIASKGINEELHSLAMFFENNLVDITITAKDYMASLHHPLAEMSKIYLPITKDESLQGKMGDMLIERIEEIAIDSLKGMEERLPFNFKQMRLSESVDNGEKQSEHTIITALVVAGKNNDKKGYVNFPTTADTIKAALHTDNLSDCKITYVSCEAIPTLANYIEHDTTIDELQYIAEKVVSLSANERENITAFLEASYLAEETTVKHVMDALENRGSIYLDTTMLTDKDIGETWLAAALENCQPAIDRLSSSNDLSDKNFMKYIQLLNENFDTAVYGQRLCEENDMYITSKGVVSVDWLAYYHRENREVPDECCLSAQSKPSILKQVDENKAKIAANDQQGTGKQKKKENSIDD